ncbi:serpin family protein [Natranaerofaba carboxydovora]|uniref:serpin family protein n=1 Tax=Natranaerofaba carboxydovora TaxID=2742683 RepID=UPI001F12C8ED|nr:serpin family protein [Natranaerofaba carboxydovora]UMZ74273.1 Serpin (serine protease inhibitor) [Natranaerofaba carboxydovora]
MNKKIKPDLSYLTLVLSVILVISISFSAIGCQNITGAGERYDDELRKEQIDNLERDYLTHQNEFAFNILKEILKEEDEGTNTLVSPLSINMALYMTYNGADSITKEEMEKALNLEGLELEKLNEQMKNLKEFLEHTKDGVDFRVANSIWGREGEVNFLEEFVENNKEYYDSEINELDFSKQEASDIINDWVAENTEGKIDEIVGENIPARLLLYLINTTYFNGEWLEEFPEENTKEESFYTKDDEEITHPMMKVEEEFPYKENDLFQAVSLPYKDDIFQMTLFLPKEDKSLEELTDNLTKKNWEKWQDGFHTGEGTVKLPRFSYEYEKSLVDVLKNLGMETAFTSANFSKMLESSGDLFIDEVLHKSFIEVDEKGTEAAAATKVAVEEVAAPKPFEIEFNRPFFYVIENTEADSILFMGTLYEPKE